MKKSIKKNYNCLICDRINLIRTGENPYFVKELSTGYVVVGDFQIFRGYTLFLCKIHASELHELPPNFLKKYLLEMALVAKATFQAFKPVRLNYELLGNTDHHMHWHIFPRHANDPMPRRTVWNIPKKVRFSNSNRPNKKNLNRLKLLLSRELNRLI